MHKIVSISGTSRPNNFTFKALGVVNDQLTLLGHSPQVFDARNLNLSFPGSPASEDSNALREAVADAAGIVLATPEYHGSFAAMTKLIIENLGFPSVLSGKPIALVGVAAGRIGAIKSLEQLRSVCAHVGAIALPGAISIAGVQAAFDAEGNCTDESADKALKKAADSLISYIENYVCPKFALESLARQSSGTWTTSI